MVSVSPRATGGISRRFCWRPSLPSFADVALAALSLLVYVCTIFALPQTRNAEYCCEQQSLAVAVSNFMYGSRLGAFYGGVFDYLVQRMDKPLEQVLQAARTPAVGLPASPPGALIETARDGLGIGYPLFATAAFRVFGLHAWALPLSMLVLMAIAAAAFLVRFSSTAFARVPILYFSALTVMLFTPLVWVPELATQIPIGGERYFSLVAVLPMFHILLALLDPRPMQRGIRNAMLLAVQAAILTLAMLVRGSAYELIGAIALVCLVLAWKWRRDRGRLLALRGKLSLLALVIVGVMTTIGASAPRYFSEGHFGPLLWHRMVAGLDANPTWPFPGINAMFDCRKSFPKGIQADMTGDLIGNCIFIAYAARHNIPVGEIPDYSYGSLYETALREAFFKIAARYPDAVLEAFFYYKPQMIIEAVEESTKIGVAAYPPLARWLLLASLGITLVSIMTWRVTLPALRRMAGVTLLLALSTIPAYLAAWAVPYTTINLLSYCVLAVGLASTAILVPVRQLLRLAMSAPVKDFA